MQSDSYRNLFAGRYSQSTGPFLKVIPTFLALVVVAVLVVGHYVRGRGRRSAQQRTPSQPKPDKLDTTLGEFREMREALRPLEHTRAASRRDPRESK